MINIKSAPKTLIVMSTLLFIAGLAACSKGSSRPSDWQDSNITKGKCFSTRSFNVSALNKNRIAKMNENELLVVRTSLAEETLSQKSAVDFSDSIDMVKIEKDCPNGLATYTGPDVVGAAVPKLTTITVKGEITEISVNSITIKGEAVTVTVEKVMPDRKAEKAAYAVAMAKDSEGLSTLDITIVKNNQTTRLKQSTTLNTKQKVDAATSAKIEVDLIQFAKENEPKISADLAASLIDVEQSDEDLNTAGKLDAAEADVQALAEENQMSLEAEARAAAAN